MCVYFRSISVHVEVPSVEFEAMRRREKPEPSSAVKARVNAARALQAERFAGTEVSCNAHMTAARVGEFCRLDDAGELPWVQEMYQERLTALLETI